MYIIFRKEVAPVEECQVLNSTGAGRIRTRDLQIEISRYWQLGPVNCVWITVTRQQPGGSYTRASNIESHN